MSDSVPPLSVEREIGPWAVECANAPSHIWMYESLTIWIVSPYRALSDYRQAIFIPRPRNLYRVPNGLHHMNSEPLPGLPGLTIWIVSDSVPLGLCREFGKLTLTLLGLTIWIVSRWRPYSSSSSSILGPLPLLWSGAAIVRNLYFWGNREINPSPPPPKESCSHPRTSMAAFCRVT